MSERPWYSEGLHFECTECGDCCTGTTGYVWVSVADVERLALHVGLPIAGFGRRYLRRIGRRLALLEHVATGDCVFFDGRRCRVYEARPAQCRRYPFWPQHLESPQTWRRAAGECEGIRGDADKWSLAKIREAASAK